MKSLTVLEKTILFLGLVSLVIGVVGYNLPIKIPRQDHQEMFGSVIFVENDVRIKPAAETVWYQLSQWKKENLYEGDSIATGPLSSAILHSKEGEKLEVPEESLLVLKKNKNGEIEFEIEYGDFIKAESNVVSTIAPAVKKKIKFKKRENKINNPDNNETKEKLTQPLLPVIQFQEVSENSDQTNTNENAKEKQAQQEQNIKDNLQPEKLSITYPTLKNRWKGEKPSITLKLKDFSVYENYQIIIRKTKSKKVFYKLTTKENEFTIPNLDADKYHLIVYGVRKSSERKPASVSSGNQELNYFEIKSIEEYKSPDILYPKKNQILVQTKGTTISFKWQKSIQFSDYVFQLSRDSSFAIIEEERWTQNNLLKEKIDLDQGVWYARVAGLSEKGQSKWGSVLQFRIVFQ
jgi:hypothetical protein